MNSNLATVNSYTQSEFLKTLSYDKTLWIGLHRNSTEDWKWMADEALAYTNWARSQAEEGNCVLLGKNNTQWERSNCNNESKYLCQKGNLIFYSKCIF